MTNQEPQTYFFESAVSCSLMWNTAVAALNWNWLWLTEATLSIYDNVCLYFLTQRSRKSHRWSFPLSDSSSEVSLKLLSLLCSYFLDRNFILFPGRDEMRQVSVSNWERVCSTLLCTVCYKLRDILTQAFEKPVNPPVFIFMDRVQIFLHSQFKQTWGGRKNNEALDQLNAPERYFAAGPLYLSAPACGALSPEWKGRTSGSPWRPPGSGAQS